MCGFGSFDDCGLGFMVWKDNDLRGLCCLADTQNTDLRTQYTIEQFFFHVLIRMVSRAPEA
jgi:hypothetical protein